MYGRGEERLQYALRGGCPGGAGHGLPQGHHLYPGQRVRDLPESLRLCLRGACRGLGVDGPTQAQGQRAVSPPDENEVGKISETGGLIKWLTRN